MLVVALVRGCVVVWVQINVHDNSICNVGAWLRGCVSARLRACVGAWHRGCAGANDIANANANANDHTNTNAHANDIRIQMHMRKY